MDRARLIFHGFGHVASVAIDDHAAAGGVNLTASKLSVENEGTRRTDGDVINVPISADHHVVLHVPILRIQLVQLVPDPLFELSAQAPRILARSDEVERLLTE